MIEIKRNAHGKGGPELTGNAGQYHIGQLLAKSRAREAALLGAQETEFLGVIPAKAGTSVTAPSDLAPAADRLRRSGGAG
ncbi:hypothetical protein GCM10007913_41220 [Devosia yakushimensis]|uniref:Uncharacterized protein n=1 Tax=Devosia yakushimensis TaxID=470028 RepID=A0ABQ5UM03_9HYPH|nr:hypothetical protein GCM10007913_41220 [Devosia yakushimensis]